MISTVVLSGFAVLMVNAVTWGGVSATPRSCSVGDTITLSVDVENISPDSIYSYSVIIGEEEHSLTGFISDSVYYYTPVESGTYKFVVSIISSPDPMISLYSNSVVVSSEPESSSDESSSDESSFDPMNWMPSNWRGDDYIHPSAESTPELSYSLPSDVELSVPDGMTNIISKAFQALPAPILVLLIPTVIALFVGWWLHK